jgi:hypothetical protein
MEAWRRSDPGINKADIIFSAVRFESHPNVENLP